MVVTRFARYTGVARTGIVGLVWVGELGRPSMMLNFRTIHLYAAAAALIALGVYLLTLAPDLTWGGGATDGGELITAATTLGIPHPPGYPSYVVFGKLVSLIPLGTVALRFNLLSAVVTAAAVGLLTLTIGGYHPQIRPPAAAAAALLFAFAPLVWSQAVVAEVYSLNLLFLAAFLFAWSRGGASGWSGFWLGLAVTTHLTSLLMLPLLLVGRKTEYARAALGLALGVTPLLLLPLLARGDSPVVWGRPTDPAGWWWLVGGRLYAANLQPPDGERWLALLRALALGPMAFLVARRLSISAVRSPHSEPAIARRRANALLALAAVSYLAFAACYATDDAAVLLLPGLMVATLLIAPVLNQLGGTAFLLPALLVVAGYPARDLSNDYQPRILAEAVLSDAPPGAILLAPGDRTIFTLWYFHHVEGQRPDVIPVDANLFAFDWYRERLGKLYPALVVPADDDLSAFQRRNAAERPFCRVGLVIPPLPFPDETRGAASTRNGPPYLDCIEGNH